MSNAIRRTLRWLFASAPGAAVLVVAIGVGIGYAANTGGGETPRAGAGGQFNAPLGKDLSSEDQQALESFHQCMGENLQPPSSGDVPDPDKMRESFQAAFDKCKGNLPDDVRQDMEQHQQQEEAYRTCLDENGATPPSPGEAPSEQDLQQLRQAQKACEDKAPEGGVACAGPGGPGGPMGGPPPGVGGSSQGGTDQSLPVPPPGAPTGPGGSAQ